MAALYANENFPFQVVLYLRQLGHDVLTSQEAGMANRAIPDNDVLTFAIQKERALLTINKRDFIRLHQLSSDHFGIIVCSQDPDTESQAERISQAILALPSVDRQLIRIDRSTPK